MSQTLLLLAILGCGSAETKLHSPENNGGDSAAEEQPAPPAGGPYASCLGTEAEWDINDDEAGGLAETEFDANGRWTVFRYDAEQDGKFEEGDTADRDEAGNILVYLSDDDDRDSQPDDRWEYTWDDDGLRTLTRYDRGDDGRYDSEFFYTYDGEGHEVLMEWDDSADETIDGQRVTTWTLDGAVWTQRGEADWDLDGTIDEVETFTWTTEGLVLTESLDDDADGFVEYDYTYSYNSVGVMEWYEGAYFVNGTLDYDFVANIEYDSYGRVYSTTWDYWQDGDDDWEEGWRYDCPW